MIVRCVGASAPLSPDLHRACAPFGVVPVRADPRGRNGGDDAERVLNFLKDARVALITGPSGSGKSTLLRAMNARLVERGCRVISSPEPATLEHDRHRTIVDLLPGSAPERVGVLARAGLGDATLLPRSPAELSAGERARLALAIAMGGASPGSWVIADEFASVLDRATAQSVAHTTARWARSCGVHIVLASAHEDLCRLVGAESVVRADPSAGVSCSRGGRAAPVRVRFEDGDGDDYRALAPHHYRGGRPATRALIRRAVRTLPDGAERVAGVLVVSMPTLNGAWRELAWPGRFTSGDKRSRAKRINAELRCVSRVIVEPSSRGLGIARALVDDYLASSLTRSTEAIAQMGAFCPFFERAGMRSYPLATGADDARWIDALDTRGVDAASGIDPARADELAEDPLVQRELDRWARARKLVRGLRGLAGGVRVRAAASLASTPATAYAAERSR